MEPRARDQAPRWQPEQGPAQRGWGERPIGRGGPEQRRGSGRAEPGPGRAAAALHRPRRAEDPPRSDRPDARSEEHTSELQSQSNLVCRLLLEKKKKNE